MIYDSHDILGGTNGIYSASDDAFSVSLPSDVLIKDMSVYEISTDNPALTTMSNDFIHLDADISIHGTITSQRDGVTETTSINIMTNMNLDSDSESFMDLSESFIEQILGA